LGTITRREQQAIRGRSNQQPTRTASYAPGQLAPIFNNAVEGVDVHLEPDHGKTPLERGVPEIIVPLLSRQLLAPATGSSFHERLFPNCSSPAWVWG